MKKLLVAAMGMAVAYGAFASPVSSQRFEEASSRDAITIDGLNELAGDTYWSDTRDTVTNTYTIEEFGSYVQPTTLGVPTNALKVATKFGQPLELKSNLTGGETIGDGLYFDSLVKFTVCDDDPVQEYTDAKIVMWLQEATNEVGTVTATNIMVRAGYLSIDDGKVAVDGKTYNCGPIGAIDIEKFHRVTIKAIQDITTAGRVVPAFAIYIDGRDGNETAWKLVKCTSEEKWDGSFNLDLTSAADYLNTQSALFPSMVQSGSKAVIEGVGFDGTGSISDLTFTHDAPSFAVDHGAAVAYVTIGGEEIRCEDFESAVDAVNEVTAGNTATLKLAQNMALGDASLVFTAAAGEIVLDFNGFVLTNELADAAITNSAANLIITNSVGMGGIVCTGSGNALALIGGTTVISDGVINGTIGIPPTSLSITGGYFAQPGDVLGAYLVPNDGSIELAWDAVLGLYKVGPKQIVFHTITFDANGGEFPQEEATQEVENGEAATRPTNPTKSGYNFKGWFYDDGGDMMQFYFEDDDDPTAVEDDYELIAQWDAVVVPTYTITFVYGLNGEYSVTQLGIQAGETPTLPAEPETPYAITGYNIAWPTFEAASSNATYTATYTGKTFTIVTYTNGVVNTSKEFTYAGVTVAPADPLYDSATETWDNKWYTTNGGSTEFAFDAAGELTQNAYATIETKGGSSDWDSDPSKMDESKTAAQEYPALADTPLATANAKKLTIWAKANSVTLSEAGSATTALVESYLLNCAPADLEAAKAAFKLDISFDGSGNPVVTLPVGKEYNVTPTMKGSNDLSTWENTDAEHTSDYQFFKYELSL